MKSEMRLKYFKSHLRFHQHSCQLLVNYFSSFLRFSLNTSSSSSEQLKKKKKTVHTADCLVLFLASLGFTWTQKLWTLNHGHTRGEDEEAKPNRNKPLLLSLSCDRLSMKPQLPLRAHLSVVASIWLLPLTLIGALLFTRCHSALCNKNEQIWQNAVTI